MANIVKFEIDYSSHAKILPAEALHDLDWYIEDKEAELSICNLTHKQTRGKFLVLALCFERRYGQIKSRADLDASIRAIFAAGDVCYPVDEVYFAQLQIAIALVLERYRISKMTGDIDLAIDLLRKSLTSPDCQLRSEILAERSILINSLLYNMYEATNQLQDLDHAIKFGSDLAATKITSVFSKHNLLINLSFYMDKRFSITQETEDLRLGLAWASRALDLNFAQCLNDSDANQIHYLFGKLYESCHKSKTQVLVDEFHHLERASSAHKLENITRRRVVIMKILCSIAMYEYLNMEDQREKILEYLRVFRPLIFRTEQNFLEYLKLIAKILRQLYDLSKHLSDLEAAIEVYEEVVRLLPMDRTVRLSWLGTLYQMVTDQYDLTHNVINLRKKMEVSKEMLKWMEKNDSDYPTLLGNLATNFRECYEQLTEKSYLLQALDYGRRAVKAFDERQDNRSRHTLVHYQLAMILLSTLNLNAVVADSDMDDLDEARAMNERALEYSSGDGALRAEILDSLGNNLRVKYQLSGDIHYLDSSISMTEEAIQITTNSRQRTDFRHNLGLSLSFRFNKSKNQKDLDRAISETEQSLTRQDIRPYKQADRLSNLGDFAMTRYKLTHATEDLQIAIGSLQKGADMVGARPLIRIKMARKVAELLRTGPEPDWEASWQYVRKAVDLIPLLSPRHLSWKEQQSLLENLSGLNSEACATALAAGKGSTEAVRVLEFGRGILLSYSYEMRTDTSRLKAANEHLYKQFESLKKAINTPIAASNSDNDVLNDMLSSEDSHLGEKQAIAFQKLQRTIEEIRSLPGFANFLLPPGEDELITLARGGCIVVLNQSSIRSDAIVITKEMILEPLRLSGLEGYNVARWNQIIYKRCVKGKRSDFAQRNLLLQGALAEIWTRIVGPICEHAGLQRVLNGITPRVWWIGVGQLSRLPLHAAGTFLKGTDDFIHCRAISSYASTIRMLRYTREKSPRPFPSHLKGLIVTVQKSPGKKILNFANDEKTNVLSAGKTVQWSCLTDPSPAKLTSSINEYQLLHLVSHAVSDNRDPSKSHLVLHGAADSANTLTVRSIAGAIATRAELVFLSACCTADNSAEKLLDETLQIGTAFQLAGFPHVIGTLWEAYDHICSKFAKGFYETLSDHFGDERSDDAYASFYHVATLRIITKYREFPIYWAPFVHYGP